MMKKIDEYLRNIQKGPGAPKSFAEMEARRKASSTTIPPARPSGIEDDNIRALTMGSLRDPLMGEVDDMYVSQPMGMGQIRKYLAGRKATQQLASK